MTTDGDTLKTLLGSEDVEQRRAGVAGLLGVAPPAFAPLLLLALSDDDWRVRKEAVLAGCERIDVPGLLDALAAALSRTFDVGLCNAAVDVLASAGGLAVPPIVAVLGTLDADGRKLAIEVLGKSNSEDALDALEAHLADPSDNVRAAALESIAMLGAIAPERVERVLSRVLVEPADALLKLTALRGLRELGARVASDRIAPMLEVPLLRSAALGVLALEDDSRAVQTLSETLATAPRGAVLAEAIQGLWHMSEGAWSEQVKDALLEQPGAVERILSIARGDAGEAEQLRGTALLLAARIGVRGAVDVALGAVASATMSSAARDALQTLGAPAALAIASAIAHPNDLPADARAMLAEIAANLAMDATRDVADAVRLRLRELARDRASVVATTALVALGDLGDASDLELVSEVMRSTERAIGSAAERTLGELARRFPDEAIRCAAAEIEAEPPSLRVSIILGSVDLGGTEGIDSARAAAFLAHAARRGDARTRAAAVRAVPGAAPGEAISVLSLALADEERDVQLAAARGLGMVGAHDFAFDPSLVLDLVSGVGDPALLAVTVRSLAEPDLDDALRERVCGALRPLAERASSSIAMAAVDALAQLSRTQGANELERSGLDAGLRHADEGVVRATMLKLDALGAPVAMLVPCLRHPDAGVRTLAVEMLASRTDDAAATALEERAAVEDDRSVREAIDSVVPSVRRRVQGARGA